MRNDFNGSILIGSGHATAEERASAKEDAKDLANITHPFSGSERNRLFLSSHGDSFLDLSGISGVDSPSDGRVSVWLDMDRDGRQDLAVVNSNRPLLQLYRNETGDAPRSSNTTADALTVRQEHGQGNFIALRFVGGNNSSEPSREFSNRDGFGASVVVQTGDHQITREHLCGQGFAGQNSSTMLIGLGEASTIDKLSVTWPSGIQQSFTDLLAGKLIILFERSADITITDYERTRASASPTGEQTVSTQSSTPLPTLPPAQLAAAVEASLPKARLENSQLIVLTTMASWCTSCAKHQPLLKTMSKDFETSDVSFIGFAGDPADPADELQGFVKRLNIDYPVITAPNAVIRLSVEAILNSGNGAEVLPSTIVLNRRGQVLATHSGIPTVSELHRQLAIIRAEKTE